MAKVKKRKGLSGVGKALLPKKAKIAVPSRTGAKPEMLKKRKKAAKIRSSAIPSNADLKLSPKDQQLKAGWTHEIASRTTSGFGHETAKVGNRKRLGDVGEASLPKKVKIVSPSPIGAGPKVGNKRKKPAKIRSSAIPSDVDLTLSPQDLQRYEQLKAAGWTHEIGSETSSGSRVASTNKLTQKERVMIRKLKLRAKSGDAYAEALPEKARKKRKRLPTLESNEGYIPTLPLGSQTLTRKVKKKRSRLQTVEQNLPAEPKLGKKARKALEELPEIVEISSGGPSVGWQMTPHTREPEPRGSAKKQRGAAVQESEDIIMLESGGKEDQRVKKSRQKKSIQPSQQPKKKRYVLFVGQVPHSSTKEDLEKHFEHVGTIVSVRQSTEKGIAFVEVEDQYAYEKGLSLHHSFMGGRRINVEYTHNRQAFGGKAKVQRKNLKLQALRRKGKLTGSIPVSGKRSARRAKQRNALRRF